MCFDTVRLSPRSCDIVVGISAVDPAAHVYSHLVAIYYTLASAKAAYCRRRAFKKIPSCIERRRMPNTEYRSLVDSRYVLRAAHSKAQSRSSLALSLSVNKWRETVSGRGLHSLMNGAAPCVYLCQYRVERGPYSPNHAQRSLARYLQIVLST